jgi:hypothetical protein
MNWVNHASRLLEQRLKQDAEAWIRVQEEVSREFAEPRLLCPPQLKHLREEIDEWLALALQNLKDQIEKTAAACGYTGPLPGIDYYTVIRGRVAEVVVTCLEVLEAEAALFANESAEAVAVPATHETEEKIPNPSTALAQKDAASNVRDVQHRASTWDTVEISFLSDERVEIRSGSSTETRNYAELGFEDRRNGKPNKAWVTLRELATADGVIRDAAKTGTKWPRVEKRMQEIRSKFREHFGITADPLPFIPGSGYRALFKIGCRRSYET